MSKSILSYNGWPLAIGKIPLCYDASAAPEPPPVDNPILVFVTEASINTFDPAFIVSQP